MLILALSPFAPAESMRKLKTPAELETALWHLPGVMKSIAIKSLVTGKTYRVVDIDAHVTWVARYEGCMATGVFFVADTKTGAITLEKLDYYVGSHQKKCPDIFK